MAKVKTKTKTGTKQEAKILRSSEVREQILEINEQKEKGYVNLALLLYEAYTGKYAIEWGYKDFKSYTEAELATKYRKAMNFVEIGEKVISLKLPKSRIEKIGWSKLRILVSVLNKDNVQEWLDQAEGISYRELDEIVRKERVDKGDLEDKPKVTKLILKMSEAEAGIIESALEEAKKLVNSDNNTLALEMICSDWLEVKGATPQKTSLADHLAYLEKVYGCKVEEGKSEEAVIGEELTENALAEEGLDDPGRLLESLGKTKDEATSEVEEKKEVKTKAEKSRKSRTRKPRSDKGTKVGLSEEVKAVEEKVLADTEGSSTGDSELDNLLGL